MHVVDVAEADCFQGCRRAWDFGSAARQNLEPASPPRPFDLATALRDALGAWYFPAMWAWNRTLVQPITVETFHKTLRAQRQRWLDAGAGPFPEGEWEAAAARGQETLAAYFDWAPGVDDFTAVRVGADLDVVVPDPDQAGAGLLAPDGTGVRFHGRIDLLVADEHSRLWLVEHRVVEGDWCDPEILALDPRCAALAWAVEAQYDARLSGVLVNEVRPEGGPPAAARIKPGRPAVTGDAGGCFRRTRVRTTPQALRRLRRQFAAMARAMVDPDVAVYPSPAPALCSECQFRAPCLALSAGEDARPVLEASYRTVVPETIPLPPRTGSLGPQRVYGWRTKGPGVRQPY